MICTITVLLNASVWYNCEVSGACSMRLWLGKGSKQTSHQNRSTLSFSAFDDLRTYYNSSHLWTSKQHPPKPHPTIRHPNLNIMAPPATPVDPLSGHVGHLSIPQEHTLKKFKEELQAEGWLVPERHDDATLLRFLRARKFDLARAKLMIIAQEQWRKDFGVDEIVK